jgi:hypothetical protein
MMHGSCQHKNIKDAEMIAEMIATSRERRKMSEEKIVLVGACATHSEEESEYKR